MPTPRKYTQKFTSNPFIANTLSNVRFGKRVIKAKDDTAMIVIGKDDNSMQGSLIFAREHHQEATEFIKMYASGVKKMLELNAAGLRVFAYIQKVMMDWPKNYSTDKIVLNFEEIADIKVTKQSWYMGIKDLIIHGVIAETPTTHIYWLNMDCFFRGDRFAFLDTYYLNSTYTKFHEEQLTLGTGFEEVPKEQ